MIIKANDRVTLITIMVANGIEVRMGANRIDDNSLDRHESNSMLMISNGFESYDGR